MLGIVRFVPFSLEFSGSLLQFATQDANIPWRLKGNGDTIACYPANFNDDVVANVNSLASLPAEYEHFDFPFQSRGD
jgi:hypothetical protein